MINKTALRAEAKELRLALNFQEALLLYQELWDETQAEIDAAGILHCLRKEKEYAEAILFSQRLPSGPYRMDWLKNELAWTYIEGRLLKVTNNEPIPHVIETAEMILDLKPDLTAVKTAAFIVLKMAKQHDRWDIIDEWVEKIDPANLSNEPKIANGRTVRSDQSSWYNYRIRCFIELNHGDKALELLNEIEDKFPLEGKYFLRLKGLASYKIHLLPEAAEIYKQLCSAPKSDWWLLHEYANVIHSIAQRDYDVAMMEQALYLMYRAANIVIKTNKLESMLRLLHDIAEMNQELRREAAALPHLLLITRIREENKWPTPTQTIESIHKLSVNFDKEYLSKTKRELITECQKTWGIAAVDEAMTRAPIKVRGKVRLGPTDRPYCFLITEGKHCFCSKSKLPPGLRDGDEIKAEIISAFDAKKKQDGWKVVKVWQR